MYHNQWTLLTKTYDIIDASLYSPSEVSSNVSEKRHYSNFIMSNTGDWELTAQIKSNNGFLALSTNSNAVETAQTQTRYIGIGANSTNAKLGALGYTNDIDNQIWVTNGSWSTSDYHDIKLTRQDDLYSFYIDGNLHASTTSVGFGNYTQLYIFSKVYNNRSFNMKNLIVKPL